VKLTTHLHQCRCSEHVELYRHFSKYIYECVYIYIYRYMWVCVSVRSCVRAYIYIYIDSLIKYRVNFIFFYYFIDTVIYFLFPCCASYERDSMKSVLDQE
jgi:hypothetical protein